MLLLSAYVVQAELQSTGTEVPAQAAESSSTTPWYNQIEILGKTVGALDLVIALLVILTTYQISRFLQEVAERGLRRANITAEGTVGTIRRITHYTVMLIGFLTAMDQLGINLQTLLTAGAIFAVAFGFAMQNIAQNFVSGMILLVERSIKPGDVLEVDNQVVRVVEMGIRATVVRGLDDEEMIVPNSTLVQNTVKNYTLRDQLHRLRAVVGVAYSSDMQLVRETLEETARGVDWRVQGRAPRVHLLRFDDSAVIWEVSVWIQNAWISPRQRSRLYEAIWFALKDKDITVAFPQLDLHIDNKDRAGLETLAVREVKPQEKLGLGAGDALAGDRG